MAELALPALAARVYFPIPETDRQTEQSHRTSRNGPMEVLCHQRFSPVQTPSKARVWQIEHRDHLHKQAAMKQAGTRPLSYNRLFLLSSLKAQSHTDRQVQLERGACNMTDGQAAKGRDI